jgi:UDPglucose 6-dehydrogenase
VVQKSTAPVGTARVLWKELQKKAGKRATIDVTSNPEFLREGSAIETSMRPDRIVVGAETPRAEKLMRELNEPLYLLETPITVTTLETAELVKYASNAFLATKISFINEVANLCEVVAPTSRPSPG